MGVVEVDAIGWEFGRPPSRDNETLEREELEDDMDNGETSPGRRGGTKVAVLAPLWLSWLKEWDAWCREFEGDWDIELWRRGILYR